MILNDEQKMVQDMLRDFSQSQLKPTAAERDKTGQFPAEELKQLGELGALGMTIPPEWGGAGLDYVSLVLALEEIAAGDGDVISEIVDCKDVCFWIRSICTSNIKITINYRSHSPSIGIINILRCCNTRCITGSDQHKSIARCRYYVKICIPRTSIS